MADLDGSDLDLFTNGRVTDDKAESLVAAALASARRYAGWPVSPVATETVTLDGPGGWRLFLKTRKVTAISSVVENGVTLTIPSQVVKSADVPGMLIRRGACWTTEPSSIVVTFSHGYTEDEAKDWRRAVLTLADMMSREGSRDSPDLVLKKIDDVQYQWSDRLIDTDTRLSTLFAPFRILPAP